MTWTRWLDTDDDLAASAALLERLPPALLGPVPARAAMTANLRSG
jgi:hypothetical protein